ncbi:Nn.00g057750.m01.CDS01 [Neocucurbitaria sp. VM-36]
MVRASSPNTFFFAPYDGKFAPDPPIRSAGSYLPYEPLYRRKHSGTKYDVRSTYSKDYSLRSSPYRVSKPSTTRWTSPSSSTFSSSFSPHSLSSTPSSLDPCISNNEARCFAPQPITDYEDTTAPFLLDILAQNLRAIHAFFTIDDTHIEETLRERAWNDREVTLLSICEYKELWFERKMQPLRRVKRWAIKKLRFAPRWACMRAVKGVLSVCGRARCEAGRLEKYIEESQAVERGREGGSVLV